MSKQRKAGQQMSTTEIKVSAPADTTTENIQGAEDLTLNGAAEESGLDTDSETPVDGTTESTQETGNGEVTPPVEDLATDPFIQTQEAPVAVAVVEPFWKVFQNEVLGKYQEIMGLNVPATVEQQVFAQLQLRSVILDALKQTGHDFTEAMNGILNFFRENSASTHCCHEMHIFRAYDSLPIPRDQRVALEDIVYTFITICHPAKRPLVHKQIDLNKVLASFADREEVKQRLVEYLGIQS